MTLFGKFMLLGAVGTAFVAIGTAVSYGLGVVDTYRPYALKVTEKVVADMQLAQYGTDLRDIDSRIVRLENQRKLFPQRWTQQDEAELRYWYQQRDMYHQRMKSIQQQQRPQYYGPYPYSAGR